MDKKKASLSLNCGDVNDGDCTIQVILSRNILAKTLLTDVDFQLST